VNDSVNVSPITTTTYTVTGTSLGCSNTATVTITVNPNPTVSATATPNTICVGSNSLLTSTGATSYNWSGGLGVNDSVNVSPITTTTYTVTGTSLGCSNTATVTITVNPNPTVSVLFSLDTVCSGNSIQMFASGANNYMWIPTTGLDNPSIANPTVTPSVTTTYTVYGSNGCMGSNTVKIVVIPSVTNVTVSGTSAICLGNSTTLIAAGANDFTWSPATGLSSTIGASVIANPTITTTYVISGFNGGGCSAATVFTVTVDSIPNFNLSNDATICEGGNVFLTASGATNYTWTPSVGLNNSNIANPVATPSVTTTYTVTGITGACNALDFVTITVNPIPLVEVTATPNVICEGETSSLQATGASSYAWSPIIASGSNVSVSPITTTTYTVTGTSLGCTNSATVNLVVVPKPEIDTVTYNGNITTFKGHFPGGISYIVVVNSDTAIYFPLVGDTSEAKFNNLLLSEGDLIIVYTLNSQCFDDYFISFVGTEDWQKESGEISYYPNPFTDVLNVDLPSGEYQASLLDVTGKIVWKNSVNGNFQIQRGNLATGIYSLIIIENDKQSFVKIVVR
jgi:hypothetical protein